MFRESPYNGDFLSPSHHTYDAVPSLEVPTFESRLSKLGIELRGAEQSAQIHSGPLEGVRGKIEKVEKGRALLLLEGTLGIYVEVNTSALTFVS